MDSRYRKKYGMSMIYNLGRIADVGVRNFVRSEKERWRCPECKGIICVHKPQCVYCGHEWLQE